MELHLFIEEAVSAKKTLVDILKVCVPIMLTIVAIIIGFYQFKKELNRKMYEKRLSQVYAPLIGIIAKQEFFREWEDVNIPFKYAQVLELSSERIENGETIEKYAFIDRNKLAKTVSDIDLGFANPRLIKAIKEFELIVDIQNNTEKNGKLHEAASKRQGKVELELLKEIINGYRSTIDKLDLDDISDADCLSFPHITKTETENY